MFKPKAEDKQLQDQIDRVYNNMTDALPWSDEYQILLDQLTKLNALKDNQSKSRVSSDALVTAASSLAGILLIIGHERVNVVTSKALAFVPKLK